MVNIENAINESDHKNLAISFNSKFPKNCYLQGFKIPKIERVMWQGFEVFQEIMHSEYDCWCERDMGFEKLSIITQDC